MPGRFQNLETEEDKRKAFVELVTKPMGKVRRKAIETIMQKRGISYEEAVKLQARKIVGYE